MPEKVLNLKGIHKSYDQNKVLDNIDFTVEEGTIMGLVGKNGAGKTTLIKCLLGLIQPDEGETFILGEPAWNLSTQTKHRIGYVPQAMANFSWMTVEQMLNYTGAFYSHWNSEKVRDLVNQWELDLYAKIANISEGQRQKLAIIQAMGHEPDVYIFDEPVASLDPVARRQFIKQLIQLNNDEGKTMLFSTHITSDLERVAADVALLKDSHIVFNGDLSDLKDLVYRLHIQSQSPLPDPLPIANLLNAKIDGQRAVATVNGLAEDEIPALANTLSATIEIEHLNLEDIFLEMNK